jgi:hypothetical protein
MEREAKEKGTEGVPPADPLLSSVVWSSSFPGRARERGRYTLWSLLDGGRISTRPKIIRPAGF